MPTASPPPPALENADALIIVTEWNELAIIFDKIGIDTSEVLKAAGTKWNFLKFSPSLVGGHCIGVDPYYLTLKAETLGYHPQVITSGSYIKGARVNVLGLTFKENCADPEEALHEYGVRLFTWDELPRADAIVAAVSHTQLASMQVEDFAQKLIKGGGFIDVKACFDAQAFEAAGIKVWRL